MTLSNCGIAQVGRTRSVLAQADDKTERNRELAVKVFRDRRVSSARLRPPRLGFAHRCAAVLVDLHHEATGVLAREPPQAFRATEDDRVGVGPRLDREAFRDLLVKEGVESILPCAHRVDLARHLVGLVWPATQGAVKRGRRVLSLAGPALVCSIDDVQASKSFVVLRRERPEDELGSLETERDVESGETNSAT